MEEDIAVWTFLTLVFFAVSEWRSLYLHTQVARCKPSGIDPEVV